MGHASQEADHNLNRNEIEGIKKAFLRDRGMIIENVICDKPVGL